jgi:hypothetical protein
VRAIVEEVKGAVEAESQKLGRNGMITTLEVCCITPVTKNLT